MQLLSRRLAHGLERVGLALLGAAAGLFVGIHTGSSIEVLMNQGYLVIMSIGGAAGFYLGIDTPQRRLPKNAVPSRDSHSAKVGTAELLTAIGTFLAALGAFASVAWIVLGRDGQVISGATILAVWLTGLAMQVGAGTITRLPR